MATMVLGKLMLVVMYRRLWPWWWWWWWWWWRVFLGHYNSSQLDDARRESI
jgi:hypothetical protein